MGHHFLFFGGFPLFIFEKKRGIPLFSSWHFHALLSRNNAKCFKNSHKHQQNLLIFKKISLISTRFLNAMTKGDINS